MDLEETYDLWLNSPIGDLKSIESVLGGILDNLKRQQKELDRLSPLMNSNLNDSLTSTPLSPKAKGLIPVTVGLTQINLTQDSARELINAMDDWFDGELPDDLLHLRRLLSSLR